MFVIGLIIAGIHTAAVAGTEASRTSQVPTVTMECEKPFTAVQNSKGAWYCTRTRVKAPR